MRILFYVVLGSGIGFFLYLIMGLKAIPAEWLETGRDVGLIVLLGCGSYVLYRICKQMRGG